MAGGSVSKKKRAGRHPVSPEYIRNIRVNVYLNRGEWERLKALADSPLDDVNKLALPDYLRRAGLNNLPVKVPGLNRVYWQELSKVAANLNQIAYRLNVGDDPGMVATRNVLRELREKLVGARFE